MKFSELTEEEQQRLAEWGALRAADVEAQIEPSAGKPEENPNFDPSVELWRLSWQRRGVEAAIAKTVARSRELGLSWNTIGRALGVTAEAARKRYKAPHEAA